MSFYFYVSDSVVSTTFNAVYITSILFNIYWDRYKYRIYYINMDFVSVPHVAYKSRVQLLFFWYHNNWLFRHRIHPKFSMEKMGPIRCVYTDMTCALTSLFSKSDKPAAQYKKQVQLPTYFSIHRLIVKK